MFGGWMLNPWLLGGGAVLIAAPILIHLLNKRRLRIIDWAAMDFLIAADKRNRRRIQLEELLLLLLRCLAVLLTGLLVARPFLPSSMARRWFASVRTERIVLLDDSPSMAASEQGSSPFERARSRLREFVTSLAEDGKGDSLTLVLASSPDRPLLTDLAVNAQSAGEILAQIDALRVSDLACRMEAACLGVQGQMAGSERINRVVYVATDLRRNDWTGTDPRAPEEAALEAVRALADEAAGCFVVDFSEGSPANLAVSGVAPETKSLLAGVTSRFHVTVQNYSGSVVHDVPVRFVAGGSLPVTGSIDSIPAGGSASAPFLYTFAAVDAREGEGPEPVEIVADLGSAPPNDALAADNSLSYAAHVLPGIRTLIVDGDPSTELGKSESFFLQRALAPPGRVDSGVLPQVVSDAEFETRLLDDVQVVCLCNVYHLGEARRESLMKWVAAGGGLVVWPGGQIDQSQYNEELFAAGRGLLPGRLDRIDGDESEKTWVSFSVDLPDHPSVRPFSGDAVPLLENAKVFQWWHVGPDGLAPGAVVVMRLTDADRSPAMIDWPLGRGRVVQVNIPADADWSNWPEDASYLIVAQELNRYLAKSGEDRGQVTTGRPIEESLDPAQFETAVLVRRPDGVSFTRQAVMRPGTSRNRESSPDPWDVVYEDTNVRGFYRLEKTSRDGTLHSSLFAVNLRPEEGDLAKADSAVLERAWQGGNVRIVKGDSLTLLTTDAAQGELWMCILAALVAILFLEQSLGWWFGRRR